MKTESKTVILIIITSSLLGLTYNYFSPLRIPIFPEQKILKQAGDSLFYTLQDTSQIKNIDSSKQNEDQNVKKTEEEPSQNLIETRKEKPVSGSNIGNRFRFPSTA